jgi:Family of unknown function (DUF5906)
MPGQVLALVGPRDCGKSLLQSLITLMLGGHGREADPSLWLLKGNSFNSDMWSGEHLLLGDEELAENLRDRHALRERLRKLVTARIYPLSTKYRNEKSFRPIWRITLSGNDDSKAIAILPSPTDNFKDKIIYLKCYQPLEPYHDGTEEAGQEFWENLVAAVPAFLHQIETTPTPERYRASRFYVKDFQHPAVVELIANAQPVARLGELIDRWLENVGQAVEGSASEILEQLRSWYKEHQEANLTGYSKDAAHFGRQLSELSELPIWAGRIAKVGDRRVGPNKSHKTIWRISHIGGLLPLLQRRLAFLAGTHCANSTRPLGHTVDEKCPPPEEKEPADLSTEDDPVIAMALEIFREEIHGDTRSNPMLPTGKNKGRDAVQLAEQLLKLHLAGAIKSDEDAQFCGVLIRQLGGTSVDTTAGPYRPTKEQLVRIPCGLTQAERKKFLQDDLAEAIGREFLR